MLAQRPAPESDQATWDQKEMPFTEHLRELRNRLLIAIVTVGGIAVLLFWPSQYAIRWMMHEYFGGIELHAFGPADVIFTEFKFSVIGGIVIGLPLLLQQLWLFVVPAIHPRTRRMVYAFIVPSLLLAAAGLAFAHFVVIPRVISALLHITDAVATPTFGVAATLNFVMVLLALFAVIFQTPIVLIGLARLGIVSARSLIHYRRHAIFAFFIAGGLAAPDGSPLTMALLALPMYALYELSIWIIYPLEKRWRSSSVGSLRSDSL
ncbi:MAG TPA: twin-arginine translocase subunit TatC [Candidatus Baltobacteraceae bacterium]|nr:twin-arginine translocase subunit TatC [Candidatus Baltobacteraceae bacterium]